LFDIATGTKEVTKGQLCIEMHLEPTKPIQNIDASRAQNVRETDERGNGDNRERHRTQAANSPSGAINGRQRKEGKGESQKLKGNASKAQTRFDHMPWTYSDDLFDAFPAVTRLGRNSWNFKLALKTEINLLSMSS
jgi:hypothetical protein